MYYHCSLGMSLLSSHLRHHFHNGPGPGLWWREETEPGAGPRRERASRGERESCHWRASLWCVMSLRLLVYSWTDLGSFEQRAFSITRQDSKTKPNEYIISLVNASKSYWLTSNQYFSISHYIQMIFRDKDNVILRCFFTMNRTSFHRNTFPKSAKKTYSNRGLQ